MRRLDEIDLKILRLLQEDARMPFAKVAREVGVSEATVHMRVKKLREMNVLKGFQALIDPSSVGKGLTAITLIKADPLRYHEILEKLKSMDDVYEVYDVTGEYDAVVKLRSNSREELARLIDSIGQIGGVVSTLTMIVLKTVKEDTRIKF
ncbi:AsnC family transcriptional regulator [Candidatus Geothermarchaeota archaeon ex4572_27]|nr:MAG: AsnC family transcriptional regulator [Candidatus Geothermarchaeota archaeon ex4572_27]